MSDTFKLSNKNKDCTFCFACLSTDRNLYPLGNYAKVFRNICELSSIPSSNIYVCWECGSVLRRVKLFKIQVEKAKCISKLHLVNKNNPLPRKLSNLTIVKSGKIVHIKHDEKDETKKKTVQKVQTHLFRYVFKDGMVKRSLFRKRIPISKQDLKLLLDTERESDFFKSFKFRCTKCVLGWRQENGFVEHTKIYHDKANEHECLICFRLYSDKNALITHTYTHNYVQECNSCHYRTHCARLMTRHLISHKKTVQCVHCGSCFGKLTQFYAHYKDAHGTFICDLCKVKFKSKYTLEKHIKRHNETKQTIECTRCKIQYKSRACLQKHMHHQHSPACGEDAYCAPCDKQYRNQFIYRRHLYNSVAHNKERYSKMKKVPCPDCGAEYSRRAYMINHYKHVHQRKSNYFCTHCCKHFLNRTRYVDHMTLKHEGVVKEKNKLCNICGKVFASNRTLLNHVRLHADSRPFPCPQPECGAAFTERENMLQHYDLHKKLHKKSDTGDGSSVVTTDTAIVVGKNAA